MVLLTSWFGGDRKVSGTVSGVTDRNTVYANDTFLGFDSTNDFSPISLSSSSGKVLLAALTLRFSPGVGTVGNSPTPAWQTLPGPRLPAPLRRHSWKVSDTRLAEPVLGRSDGSVVRLFRSQTISPIGRPGWRTTIQPLQNISVIAISLSQCDASTRLAASSVSPEQEPGHRGENANLCAKLLDASSQSVGS